MQNIKPSKLIFTGSIRGYTKLYLSHTPHVDADYRGKVIWANGQKYTYPDSPVLWFLLADLSPFTDYTCEAAFYDALVDTELLDARFGIEVSSPVILKTLEPVELLGVNVDAPVVDIGIVVPNIRLSLAGEGDILEVQYREGAGAWVSLVTTGMTTELEMQAPKEGILDFRARGRVLMGDGTTYDYSPWSQVSSVEVLSKLNPPNPATNIKFTSAKISDTFEHIDVQVSWEWDKGNGGLVKSFVLEYTPETHFISSGWTKAQVVPVATAKSGVITNFPFKVPYKFRVRAVSWGPEEQNTTYSTIYSYVVDEDTVFDASFTQETNMEVNYSGISGYRVDGTERKQTFKLDAKTGSVNIGEVGPEGTSPITIDPLTGTLSVDGKIITESIYAANFILSNLGEASPALFTQGKTYGSNSSGIWTGWDDGKYKLDLGNATQNLRWDGDSLRISGDVVIGTPAGDLTLEDGITNNRRVSIYNTSINKPSTPTNTLYPPTGWTVSPTNPPTGSTVWESTGVLNSIGTELKTGEAWSAPAQHSGSIGADGATTYTWIMYATSNTGAGISSDPQGKNFIGIAPNKLTETASNEPTDYTWSKIEGENGEQGAGIYAQTLVSIPSPLVFDASQALNFFQTNFGRPPVKYDVLTQYSPSDPSKAITRQWNGASWVSAGLVVHGDAIVDGTVRAQALVADNAFLAQLGVNTIYNNSAALSSNPEANYTMKISLANGFIHIR